MTSLRQSAHEEAQTGLIWAALGAIGWTAISVTVDSTLFGIEPVERIAIVAILSLATGLTLSLPLLAVQLITGEEISAHRPGGPLFGLLVGAVLSAFVALYLVLALGLPSLILPLYGVIVAVIVWRVSLGRVPRT